MFHTDAMNHDLAMDFVMGYVRLYRTRLLLTLVWMPCMASFVSFIVPKSGRHV